MNKDFNYSYWEISSYFKPQDLLVVGAGIVGLSTAISFKQKHKKARVLVLERGLFPEGASTKNAGFACFGSAGELLDDLANSTNPDSVWDTVRLRWEGLGLLKKRLGEKKIDYKCNGGYELFSSLSEFEAVSHQLDFLNQHCEQHLGIKKCYRLTKTPLKHTRGFCGSIYNAYEGQLDSGKMMLQLEQYARSLGIVVMYNINVQSIHDAAQQVALQTPIGTFYAAQCVVATNGFARQLVKINDVNPARAQVLITSPIPNLKLKGTFHFEKGFFYFRNIHNRLLFGGGRNLDLKTEKTSDFGLTPLVQQHLDHLLQTRILPGTHYKVDYRWSGIMGLGKEKSPIVQRVSQKVVVAVRMGGMGVAIGSKVGAMAADQLK